MRNQLLGSRMTRNGCFAGAAVAALAAACSSRGNGQFASTASPVVESSAGDAGAHEDGSSTKSPDASTGTKGASVVEFHNSPTRNGQYIDPVLTKTNASKIKRNTTFGPVVHGMVRAQPLFVDGSSGGAGKDMILVATEQNWIHAITPAGSTLWSRQLAQPVQASDLACSNINPYGITGTPIIDLPSRTMFVAALTTPDGGKTLKQMIYAISIDDGTERWQVDVSATIANFDSTVQSQRSALGLVAGQLFVPYSGFLDCGLYHGWVVSVNIANPSQVAAWATPADRGSSWAVGGPASDGTSVYVATGNTAGATSWGGGEAVIRFTASNGAVFSNNTPDYFAPSDWQTMDQDDKDLGSSNPLVLDVPGASPSRVVFQLGKPTTAYILNTANLGGIGKPFVSQDGVTAGETATAPASYTTAKGTYVVANAACLGGGTVAAFRVSATFGLEQAWCADQKGAGSVVVSTTDGKSNPIVWGIGTTGDNNAAGDNRLHAFDGDTGAVIYGGGGASDGMDHLGRFQAPMIAKGSIYIGAQNALYKFE